MQEIFGYSPWTIALSLVLIIPTLYYLAVIRPKITKRIKEIERRLSRGLVYRDTKNPSHKTIRCLELSDEFIKKNPGYQMCSFGQYLSTLRAFTDEADGEDSTPALLQRHLEATIGGILLKKLGPRIGAAVLPILGVTGSPDSYLGKLSSSFASYISANVLLDMSDEFDPLEDRAAMTLTLGEIMTFVNMNQKFRDHAPSEVTPLEWMTRGEIGYDPTFTPVKSKDDNDKKKDEKDLMPNPFTIEEHLEAAILGMEEKIRASGSDYDPEDRSLPPPVPVNERVLPGLHFGNGDCLCTHTKREIIRNRVFANLLTKLSHNYSNKEKNVDADFIVQYKGKPHLYPDEFIKRLIDEGHTVEACPRSCLTTFGIAACVKEEDGSWTKIPVAFFFRTGFEKSDGRPAYFLAPHGGLDVTIKGPLIGTNSTTGELNKCDIQFYVAIDGLCAFHSNHNVEAPWMENIGTTDIYNKEQTLEAIRCAGILAVTFNSIATEMNLPFGGYGVLGLCNDSAAFVDFAVRGETNLYPLVSTGRFLAHTARRLMQLRQGLKAHYGTEKAVKELDKLVIAAVKIDSDVHNSPAELVAATRRYLATYPNSYFQLTQDSKDMMMQVATVYSEFVKAGDKSTADFVDLLFAKKGKKKFEKGTI